MSPPIFTPDGSEVSEIVLPDGSTASEVIGPDGNVVFEAGPDIPDAQVYLHDDWEDNKLTNRDDSGTTTHNGVEGEYRPEWTIVEGSPVATNGKLNIEDGAFLYADLNLDFSSDITWTFTNLDQTASDDNNGFTSIGLMSDDTSPTSVKDGVGYYLFLRPETNSYSLNRADSDGTTTELIDTSPPQAVVDLVITRSSGGTWEMFIDGVSQGTASDATHTTVNTMSYEGRDSRTSLFIEEMKIN